MTKKKLVTVKFSVVQLMPFKKIAGEQLPANMEDVHHHLRKKILKREMSVQVIALSIFSAFIPFKMLLQLITLR